MLNIRWIPEKKYGRPAYLSVSTGLFSDPPRRWVTAHPPGLCIRQSTEPSPFSCHGQVVAIRYRVDYTSGRVRPAVDRVREGDLHPGALAGDLGVALGCGAAVERLVRTRVGPFALDDATPWDARRPRRRRRCGLACSRRRRRLRAGRRDRSRRPRHRAVRARSGGGGGAARGAPTGHSSRARGRAGGCSGSVRWPGRAADPAGADPSCRSSGASSPSRLTRARVVALGTFDGIHLGHRAILGTAVARARAADCRRSPAPSSRHPLRSCSPTRAPRSITTLDERLELIAETGVDGVVVLSFTPELAAVEPEAFVRTCCSARLRRAEIVVGFNHRFGAGRPGRCAAAARSWRAGSAFSAHVVPPLTVDGVAGLVERDPRRAADGRPRDGRPLPRPPLLDER